MIVVSACLQIHKIQQVILADLNNLYSKYIQKIIMKALSTTILIVVTAVVVLVVALVVLTIFVNGIQNVTSITQAETICLIVAQPSSCLSGTFSPPPTWEFPSKRLPDGRTFSCSQLFSSCACEKGIAKCTPAQIK